MTDDTPISYLGEAPCVPGLTSIIILTWNQWNHTETCLASLQRSTPEQHEVILVDNGSTDGTVERLRAFVDGHPHARLIANACNLGFAGGNNQGLALARGEYIVLLNNDTVVPSGWLSRMLSVFQREPAVGLVGPMSNYVSGPQLVPQVPYRDFEQLQTFAGRWAEEHRHQTVDTARLVGFCLLIRRKVLDAIGGLDERFGRGNFEDDDYCVRSLFSGFKLAIAKDAFVHHTGGQSFKAAGIDYARAIEENWDLFKEKWGMPPATPLGDGARLEVKLDQLWRYNVPLPSIPDSVLGLAEHAPSGPTLGAPAVKADRQTRASRRRRHRRR